MTKPPYKTVITTTIERNGKEIEVEVTGNYYPGLPEQRYLRNGDPGYPAEAAEMEIISVFPDVDLTQAEEDRIVEKLIKRAEER
jgi:hypothetical protein